MPIAVDPLYALSGFVVGFLVGMTGVGGGALMTPLLILLFRVHPVAAVGTDLFFACITKTGGSLVHAINRTIDWQVVTRLAMGSVPASLLTILCLHLLRLDEAATSLLVTRVLGGALIVTSLVLLFRQQLFEIFGRPVGALNIPQTLRFTVMTGFGLGVLVTISSVGAGGLGAMALILLYPELPAVKIAGSNLAYAVPLTLVAGLGHAMKGGVDIAMLGSLLVGSLPGIALASSIAPRLPDFALRLLLAATLAVSGLRLLTG